MRVLTLLVAMLLFSVPAGAQALDRYAGIKAGLNAENAEDNVRGQSAAWGVLAGYEFPGAWAIEGEFWRPGAIRTDPEDGRHRDTFLSVAARRSFGAGIIRPHLLVGGSVGRTDDVFTTCVAVRELPNLAGPTPVLVSCSDPDVISRQEERFSSYSLFPLVGAGVTLRLSTRVQIVPDVRLQVWPTSVIVRPAVALVVAF